MMKVIKKHKKECYHYDYDSFSLTHIVSVMINMDYFHFLKKKKSQIQNIVEESDYECYCEWSTKSKSNNITLETKDKRVES